MSFALKLVLSPLLFAQAVMTRRRVPALPEAEGPREGQVGSGRAGLRVLIAGDSSAAGVGVANQDHAFAGHFTRTLNRRTGLAVRWRLRAKSGHTTQEVAEMLRDDPPPVADIAVILTGTNDVIGLVPPAKAIEQRAAMCEWLLDQGRVRYVLFASLPPINQFPLLPQPLRGVMGADARLHDAALARWATGKSNVFHVPVDLQLAPAAMSRDGFHPAEPVYRACGESIARFIVDKILPNEVGRAP